MQKHPEKYLIFIFTEEITIHHTPNPFSDDEGNKIPKTMDDTDPTPDAQNRRRKESRSSDTSDEQSGEENLKRKKRKTKKVQISILISIRKQSCPVAQLVHRDMCILNWSTMMGPLVYSGLTVKSIFSLMHFKSDCFDTFVQDMVFLIFVTVVAPFVHLVHKKIQGLPVEMSIFIPI